jgi:hypothetical protein
MFKLSPTATLNGASLLEVSRHPEMKRLMEEVLACDCSTECFTKKFHSAKTMVPGERREPPQR